jgi:Tfp pilus assembly protein PilW
MKGEGVEFCMLQYWRGCSVVELMIKLIIWLALITFLIPNHIANAMIKYD